MNNLAIRRLRPLLRLMSRSTRSVYPRVPPCDLTARQTTTRPLDRGSVVCLCAVCIEAGRATAATHQTRDQLCGCDQHIRQLEQYGRAAIRRQRSAESRRYTDRGAQRARETNGNRPADDHGASLGDGSADSSDDRVGSPNGSRVRGDAQRR